MTERTFLQQNFDFFKMGDQHEYSDSEFYYSGELTDKVDKNLFLRRKLWKKVRMR